MTPVPEGHTIHRLARELDKDLRGATVRAGSPQGRFAAGAERLDGQRCDGFEAYGKHLVGRFEGGDVLHVHLGLIGKFGRTIGDPVGAVRLRLATDDAQWDLRGPMTCRVVTPDLVDEVASSIGPDPLRDVGGGAVFVDLAVRRRIPIGAALLDQRVIAGIGNVYRSELLFLAGIDPLAPANRLGGGTLLHIWELASALLRVGERLNRIVTVDPALVGRSTPGALRAGERLYVYKRGGEPCRVCSTPIETIEVGGRSMWRCPACQPQAVEPAEAIA